MHDSLTFLARYIQTRGRQLPDFGTFGITPLASIRIGRGKSHTTATSLATLGGGRGAANKGVRPSSPHDPPHVLLRWHPLSGSIFALTVNSLWNSPLLLRSMTRPLILVGVLNQKKSWLFLRLFCPSVWKTKQKKITPFLYESWFFFFKWQKSNQRIHQQYSYMVSKLSIESKSNKKSTKDFTNKNLEVSKSFYQRINQQYSFGIKIQLVLSIKNRQRHAPTIFLN